MKTVFYGVQRGDGRWLTPNYRAEGYISDESWSANKAQAWRDSDEEYAKKKCEHVVFHFTATAMDMVGLVSAKL